MSGLPFTLAAFVLVLGVLVVFHELGHYLVARACGVKVLRFSFGFGRILWRRRFGADQTEWAISLFPLGGYVKMLDEREGKVPASELHRAFNNQSVLKRMLIVVAGPVANFILAFLLFWTVFILGTQDLRPILGEPTPDSPAAQAGVRNGQLVRAIDGEPVGSWSDFQWLLLQKAVDQQEARLEVLDAQHHIEWLRLELSAAGEGGWEGDAFGRLGLHFYRPPLPPVVGKVLAGSPAELAGLQPGDRVLAVNGEAIGDWQSFSAQAKRSAGIPLALDIERGGETRKLEVVPEAVVEQGREFGRVGVSVALDPSFGKELQTQVRYGPGEALLKAGRETWEKSVFTLTMIGKMLAGSVSMKNLSGPVTIADYAGQTARQGLDYYLRFMALLSISLGVLNLLPIPVLDGGHLLYYMIEVVRRKPLSEKAMEMGQRVGLSVIFVMMAFAFFNDLTRLLGG